MPSSTKTLSNATPQVRTPPSLPAGIFASLVDENTLIRYRWSTSIALRASAVVGLLFGFPFLMAWQVHGYIPISTVVILSVVALPFIYTCTMLWTNTTTITLGPKGLVVSHGPLPGKRGFSGSRGDIEQLYVVITDSRLGRSVWLLMVKLRSEKHARVLIPMIESQEAGLEIERVVEDALGITDAPVAYSGSINP